MTSAYTRFALLAFSAGPLLASSATTTQLRRSIATSAEDSTRRAPIVYPGNTTLRPGRVSDLTDTISLLITPRDSAERVYGLLVRRVFHVNIGGVPMLREIQHYQFAGGKASDDTLDVLASTLAPVRYFSANGKAVFDVHIDSTRISGWQTDTLGVRTEVNAASTHPFFVSMMTESFISAFPLDPGAEVTVPVANPPAPTVKATVLRSTTVDTLNTARGPVPCVVVLGPGNTTFWIARDDGRLVRLHWMLPNGTSVWKLPSRDVALR